jgi:poly-gamma-glutamate synthesis protein (capsule biosynthesis protein)
MNFKEIQLHPVTKNTIKLVAMSDICFYGLSKKNCTQEWFSNAFSKDVLKVVHNKDISMANLECPLTNEQKKYPKGGIYISASPESAEGLKMLKLDIGILANNHILNYGPAGMYDTISACENIGIKTLGAGDSSKEAAKPLFLSLKGKKLAFLAFTEEEFTCAGETTPGAAKLDLINTGSAIREASKNADFVVVNIHGGNEYYPFPSPRMQKWYRFFVDCGANLIIGHHPHTIQGYEIYRNVPIIYSLGSFLFQRIPDSPVCFSQGMISKFIIGDDRVCKIDLYPIEQVVSDKESLVNSVKLKIMSNEKGAGFIERFNRLSQIASDPDLVSEFWKCRCNSNKISYFNSLKMNSSILQGSFINLIKSSLKNRRVAYLINILGDLISNIFLKDSKRKAGITTLRNVVTCPAHHETIVSILEMERLGIKPQAKIQEEYDQLIQDCI